MEAEIFAVLLQKISWKNVDLVHQSWISGKDCLHTHHFTYPNLQLVGLGEKRTIKLSIPRVVYLYIFSFLIRVSDSNAFLFLGGNFMDFPEEAKESVPPRNR